MEGVTLTPLKIIKHSKGDIFHGIKNSDESFSKFGEAYFSTINSGKIKGWTKHERMILNLIVPIGEVLFVMYNKKHFFEATLSTKNYCRLTINPGIWLAFKGIAKNSSLILNLASIEHDQNEMKKLDLENISYKWD